MRHSKCVFIVLLLCYSTGLMAQQTGKIFPGADEHTPALSEYFSWINNTNEGSTEAQTLVNLAFFKWLYDEYGMKLDIYAFDAGAIDGKRFYGKVGSERFKKQFPNGFDPMVKAAAEMGIRLGVWGGPDGFGNTPEEEAARHDQMVALCRDHNFMLFKFDAVCGPLRPEKEGAFIKMMTECRRHSPDLILLNHRLGLKEAQNHATTFLWEGRETYIDVFSVNGQTAPHHRANAIDRGLVPDLQRLTEDHGVCISSCLDNWDDDLVLQAFNRALILSPQLYGSPWLLRDDEFPRLARIFNLHRKYRHLLVEGIVLPEEQYGPSAVSRGDGRTRLITMRNLSWTPKTYTIALDASIGLPDGSSVHVRRFHPFERILGDFSYGEQIEVIVDPFRAYLLYVSQDGCDEPGVIGCDFEVIKNIAGSPVEIKLMAEAGAKRRVGLIADLSTIKSVVLGGKKNKKFLQGKLVNVKFSGRKHNSQMHSKLAECIPVEIPDDADALYEATVFAADNNALEVRSKYRSGITKIPQVKAARDAFFMQDAFRMRGIWDRYLFDGDDATGFWPSRKYNIDQRVSRGCFRLDLGKIVDADRIVLHSPDIFSLEPILIDEANFVEVSADLLNWHRLSYMTGTEMPIEPEGAVRYLRFKTTADRFVEITGEKDGVALDRSQWRASNLFAHPSRMKPQQAWHAAIKIDKAVPGAKLCIAIEGVHGVEGAYAALKIGDRYIGCPDRAASYPSNTWEYVNGRRDRGYTYYVPVTKDMIGRQVDVYVIGYDKEHHDLAPIVWLSKDPVKVLGKSLILNR
ncbi:hypothetical protein KAR48_14565 [bacterium]|nr:hypothetical protein [bacterium]